MLLTVLLAGVAAGFTAVHASGPSAKTVTFSKDVAPIFFRSCAECHRPGELAPMSLLSFKDARPWAKSIKEKVLAKEMPPWHADPAHGKFENDARLSQAEIDTITAWVDQGAKEGNAKDLPKLPQFVQGWKLGKPDVVLEMQEEYTIAAAGSDEYINFTIPTKFEQDVWVQAAEINPGNKKVVHHVIAFIQPKQMAAAGVRPPTPQSIFYQDGTLIRVKQEAPAFNDGCSAPGGGIARGSGQEGLGFPLSFYTPGKDVDSWPEGTAKLIPSGSNIVIQMHYSKTTGQVEKDRTSIGLVLAKKRPEKVITSLAAINHYFKIPPGSDNHQVRACYTFGRDVELYTYLPHMHVRGKAMKYDLIYPDGRTETLLSVPRYDFNWQTMYKLEKPLTVPKGSRLLITAHYDNSAKNKYNPDPTKTVRFGDPTYDEMMVGYFDYVPVTPRGTVKLDAKALDAYAGDFTASGITINVVNKDGRLMFTALGQPPMEAMAESETRFYFLALDARVTFVKDTAGQFNELIFEINNRQLKASRVKR